MKIFTICLCRNVYVRVNSFNRHDSSFPVEKGSDMMQHRSPHYQTTMTALSQKSYVRAPFLQLRFRTSTNAFPLHPQHYTAERDTDWTWTRTKSIIWKILHQCVNNKLKIKMLASEAAVGCIFWFGILNVFLLWFV